MHRVRLQPKTQVAMGVTAIDVPDVPVTWSEMEAAMRKRFQDKFPTERLGQAYFNALEHSHPELAELVRGTSADPFHASGIKDPRVQKFFDTIIPYFT